MPPLAIYQSESSTDIEWLSRTSCNSFCEQRNDNLKKDAEALELMRDELMRTQKETIVQGLCKLNKDVKKLSVKEFNSMFGCDVIDLIRKQMVVGDVQSDGSSNGGDKKRYCANGAGAGAAGSQQQQLSLKTPAASRLGKPPMTMRTARRGEVIKSYSANGSPIDHFDHGELVVTSKKRRAANGKVNNAPTTSFPVSIGIGAGNGETIDLSDPNQRKNLDGEQKAQAMQQLMAIQEQMNQLMADF
mmetsp:Transcript_9239/g.20836  ORF Transcript_9239/g.20836 Transcript_9239/m.20836 type:complete len:245 (-) Transcript_9239:135-869(-)|eukprot:CAMPEP_0172311852 /NCGR_PEP_ID=MMETSP1058-20130122/15810_1 /TAXON_ID=83371 /ORGANISM="Detonula confervacea, Strain CCMP 353" /LENGTH=244 /DNA_ID=CAMNT_0013025147 /DNA_START=90 /DNA_END=824 /DNA_ORIENTATION=+